jgi:diguanylate cyclase (GGDEF)-like protein
MPLPPKAKTGLRPLLCSLPGLDGLLLAAACAGACAAGLLGALPAAALGLAAFGTGRALQLARERGRRERAESEAKRLTLHDPLTGLANRRLLSAALAKTIAASHRRRQTVALLVVNLDGFKAVNDLLGHAAGDDLLCAAAARLRGLVRQEASLARLGADEFALLALVDGPTAAGLLGEQVVRQLTDAFPLAGRQMRVGAAAGIALHLVERKPVERKPGEEEPGEEEPGQPLVETLLQRAGIAMSRVKAAGRSGCLFFEPGVDEAGMRRARTGMELRQAITRGEIEPHFQPLVRLPSGELLGFEALARWRHPERGLLPPAEFIGLAESSGLIEPLGLALLRAACLEARNWPGQLSLAVNLSAVQLRDRDLAPRILGILDDIGFDPHRLELEVTETAVAACLETARASIRMLRSHGVRIALDDFGTGHASLLSLRSLPFDKIKIDRSFTSEGADAAKIVAAIVGLGQSLGLRTTAEGIEDAACARRMRKLGCDYGQGFLFGKPMPASDARRLATVRGLCPRAPAGDDDRPRAPASA